MSTWFISGAQGFLGRYTVAQILASEPEARVIGVGRSPWLAACFSHAVTAPIGPVPAPLPENLRTPDPARYRYLRLDMTRTADLQRILEESRPNHIVHLATALRGDSRAHLLSSNIQATGSLFDAIAAIRQFTPHVILGSTGGVYGRLRAEDLPVSEQHCPTPIDEYAITKLAAEHLAANAARRAGVRLAISRIFNLLGAAEDERHVGGQIALQLSRVRDSPEPTITLGSLEATRDFIDVRDAAAALVALARNPEALGIVNVASGCEYSIGRLLRTFLKRTNREVTVKSVSGEPLDVPRHVGDVALLASYGFKPRYTLESSVDSIWSYYQKLWGS